MSTNYDNWERLVRAVLRREQDKQLALIEDLSSIDSSLSSVSDLSFSSRFSHDQSLTHDTKRSVELLMDFTGINLNHSQWKEMLPPDKNELVWTSSRLRFFLDLETGKNRFMLPATRIFHTEFSILEMAFHPKSRFLEVAKLELIDSCQLHIRGWMDTQILSPNTFYAAYLVHGPNIVYEEQDSPDTIVEFSIEETDNPYPEERGRADGWMEVEMGTFFVGGGGNQMRRLEFLETITNGEICVEGIEFRPLEG